MEPREQRLIIILADISGYTRFMVENQLSALHGQICISYLIETLLREIDIPLRLQEIEGDAVFLYAAHPGGGAGWQDVLAQVRTKLLRFFEVFLEGLVTASESTPCKCAVCSNAGELSLKVIVHSGSAVFHSIGGRAQVSGPDVILAHRLLKNSVQGNEYLLMSESAYRDLGGQMNLEFVEGQEAYAEFGTLKTHVHLMGEEVEQTRKSLYSLKPAALASRARQYLVWGSRLQLTAMIEEIRHPHVEASWPARSMFTLMVLLATPLVFLAGLFTIPRKLLSRQKALARSGGRRAKEPPGAPLSG